MVAYLFGRHLAGPARDERHANAAFIQITFHAAQRPVAVKERHFMASFLMRAIVT